MRNEDVRYRGLVEGIPAALIVDVPGDPWSIIYIGPQIEELLGVTPAELIAGEVRWLDLVHAEDRSRVLDEGTRHMATGDALLSTFRMVTRSGDAQWISRRSTVTRDERDGSTFSRGALIDATEFFGLYERFRLLNSAFMEAHDSMVIAKAEDPGDPSRARIIHVNEAFTESSGYAPEEAIGRPIEMLRGPSTDSDTVAELNQSLIRGIPHRVELVNYTKDGSERWIEQSVSPIVDDSGSITHYVSVQREITERRRENERATALVNNTVDLVLVATPDGTVRWASASVARVLGQEPDRFHRHFVHPDDIDEFVNTFRAVAAELRSTRTFAGRLKHADATWHDFEGVMTNLLDDPNINGIVLNAHDVTDRYAAERVRSEAEERFRAAFDNAPIGMALVGSEGRFLQVNPALCEMLGYREDELRERTFHELTHPDDLPGDLERVDAALAGTIRTYQREKRYFHSSGRVVRALINVSLVRDKDGRPLYFVSQIEDVTDRHRLEEQLRQAQKMEAVGQLAGGIAHDFNNILSIIQSYARFVIEELDRSDPIRIDVEEIVKAGDRASALVRQLLAFSRREVSIPVVLNLNDAMRVTEKLLRRTIGENIDLVTELGHGIPPIRMDSGSLEQIVMNVAINARDAMPDGGRLTIRTAPVAVAEEHADWPSLPPGSYAQISIEDTGTGITPDLLDRIFEPFFTTKSRGRGTGLGLATVYAIVKQAGGDISVRSQPNRGAIFTILLPASSEDAERPTLATRDQSPSGMNETILVVEDEEGVRRLVERILSRNGYRVLLASSGAKAIQMAEAAEDIDLLLTDVIMPEMSGVTVAETLRDAKPGLRVVFMSGYPDDMIAHHGVLAEPEMYLQKPFTIAELLTKVRVALESSSTQRLPSKPDA